jgi:protein-tyrosine phosphatase
VIDLHSHILPELDDGARSLEESLGMARIAADDGITAIVATPHAFNGLSHNPETTEILDRVAALQEAIGPCPRILPGNEVHFTHDAAEQAATGRATTLNRGPYMLIEFPSMQVPLMAQDLFRNIRRAGLTPILAHPERNGELQRHPDRLTAFIRSGVRVQVTAMSVTGRFGADALRAVETFLRHDMVHIIATDAHREKSRPPVLSEARDRTAKLIGAEAARKLVEDHPRAVIEGRDFEIPEPRPFKAAARRGGRLARLFGADR